MFAKIASRLQGNSIGAKLLKGSAQVGMANGTEQAFRFIRNMILTRLLAPEAFGQMAIVLALSSLFQVLTGMGLKEAIIQNPHGAEPRYLNGAWWISLGRGAALYLTAFIAAPFLAAFYHDPDLTVLIRIAFLQVLFQSGVSTRAWVALKELKYGRWMLVQNGGSILGILATLTMAWNMRGVWALVLGYVAEGFFRCLISFLLCPFRPHLSFDREANQKLLAFSKGIFGLPLLMLAYTEAATFVLGKMVSKETLGLYSMALTLARVPSALGGMLVDLLMPAFAQMQREPARLCRGLLKITNLISLAALPGLALACVWGDALLRVAYGEKYRAVSGVFSVLFANEIMITTNIPLAATFIALGRPELLRRFSLVRALVVVVLVYPLIKAFGLIGASMAPLIAMLTAFSLQLVEVRQLVGLDLALYRRIWYRAAAVAVPTGLISFLVHRFFSEASASAAITAAVSCTVLLGGVLGIAIWRSLRLRKMLLPI